MVCVKPPGELITVGPGTCFDTQPPKTMLYIFEQDAKRNLRPGWEGRGSPSWMLEVDLVD